jgi:hypothetical protein
VQSQPGKVVVEEVADGDPIVTYVPPEEYVWVGGTQAQKLYKLDGETGEVLIDIPAPIQVYGLALDGRDRISSDGANSGPYLWISGGHKGHDIAHIDTSRCIDNLSCMSNPVCQVTCSAIDCKSTCDNAIQTHYLLEPANTYGITVDCKQRIWTGGHSELGEADIKRSDPFAPEDQRLSEAPNTITTHGIAADAVGFIWGANKNDELVYKVNWETLESVILDVPSKGLGVDGNGLVWSIPNDGSDELHIIEPTDDLSGTDTINMAAVTVDGNPYMYSDMTGQQLKLATNDPGYYRQVFGPCGDGDAEAETIWKSIEWEVELLPGTHVIVNFRVSDTRAGLASSDWITTVISADNLTGSRNIEAFMTDLGTSAYVEIEVQLFPELEEPTDDACYSDSGISPRVKKLGVARVCIQEIHVV